MFLLNFQKKIFSNFLFLIKITSFWFSVQLRIKELKKLRQWLAYSSFAEKTTRFSDDILGPLEKLSLVKVDVCCIKHMLTTYQLVIMEPLYNIDKY